MKLQVLISTMHQTDRSLLEKMNIQSDAIVINQCDRNEVEQFTFRGHDILWMSFNERGIGLSRNNALMRANGDILLFADDDVIYDDGYAEKITKAFEANKSADLIAFNIRSLNPDRPQPVVEEGYRLHWFNCLKFGAVKIAVRRKALRNANVFFSLLFGGGAKYQHGEDTLFIVQCLQKGLKGYASTEMVGAVKQEESCWFKGYDEKYFFDTGVLMKQCFGSSGYLLLFLLLIKNGTQTQTIGLWKALKVSIRGARSI